MIDYKIAFMTIKHYEEVYMLWQTTEGVGLSDSDSKRRINKFLKRNRKLSFVTISENEIIGSVLGSHDGRRGYIHHLAVAGEYRRNGIGKALVERCLERFKEKDIQKTHVFIFKENENAIKFWEDVKYSLRNDIVIMTRNI